MDASSFDIAIIGGGIVGAATAMTLLQRRPGLSLVLLEAEDRLAPHQTGNNSGVIHSGLYYKPGSLKAKTCMEGRAALYRFCEEHKIAHDRCGKVVIATEREEIPLLETLAERGVANGITGIQRLDGAGIREYEPHAAGLSGLFVPDTGIVDFVGVTNAYGAVAEAAGARIHKNTRVIACRRGRTEQVLETSRGSFTCRMLINTAGLQCDRVARLCGMNPSVTIIPFRGEYYTLRQEKQDWVKHLIYPVPDPRFPFLGVHFTRKIFGGVEAGPNAVLAFRREGYHRLSFSFRDTAETLGYGGFWRMGRRFWKTGLAEMYRSFHKASFARALARLVPGITSEDLAPGGAGVRAQAVDSEGRLVDDFSILEDTGMIHVLNAPSPAATASMSIAAYIADRAENQLTALP